jgi:hypothetical protein
VCNYLVVEIAQDDLHSLSDLPQCVRDRYSNLIKGNEGGSCGGRICRLDRFCLDIFTPWNKDDGVSSLDDTHQCEQRPKQGTNLSLTSHGEIVCERAICNPPKLGFSLWAFQDIYSPRNTHFLVPEIIQ